MPAVARANGVDSVFSPNGTGKRCAHPMNISTGQAHQQKVFIEGVPAASSTDLVMPHPFAGCGPDEQTLDKVSSKVFVAGGGIGRIGDMYGDNVITSGSSKVFAA